MAAYRELRCPVCDTEIRLVPPIARFARPDVVFACGPCMPFVDKPKDDPLRVMQAEEMARVWREDAAR